MDDFTRGYIEAAIWASTNEDGTPLDETMSGDDFANETLREIEEDCRQFQAENAADLAKAYSLYLYRINDWTPEEQAGHDFWLTRNHQGGFWARGLGEVGEKLTEAAHKAGERNLYVGDDGKIYCDG